MNPCLDYGPGLCVTGTDTDAGKTIITAGLLRALRRHNAPALAIKPVQTGFTSSEIASAYPHPLVAGMEPDAALYAQAVADVPLHNGAPSAAGALLPPAVTWLSFSLPCSPHVAAAADGCRIELADVLDRLAPHRAAGHCLLLEGAGGVLVPINETQNMLDLLAGTALPVLVVAANRLGVINHALLTLAALRERRVPVLGVVLVHTQPEPVCAAGSAAARTRQLMLADHAPTIARLGQVPVLAEVPWLDDLHTSDPGRHAVAWNRLADALEPVAQALAACSAADPSSAVVDVAAAAHLLDVDKAHLWHPYTSMTQPLPVYEAVAAHGTRICLRNGQELVDGMASWWCAVHGYGHPQLLDAAQEQLARMAHVMFGGLTHAPAVQVAERLLPMLPRGLEHIFLADSGSVAVEVALKMAVQYWQAQGAPHKTRFVALRGGYHGDTLGAMSVCDPVTGMHSLFAGLVPEQLFVERPSCRFDAPFDPASLANMEQTLACHANNCAAVILEPVLQGAGGMWMYHPDYLRGVRALCDRHRVLLIADEIATGFGRTGRLFACQYADISPDILCVGKALTGGIMTLAATCATREVAHGISAHHGVFMHGPTFMGNPLACACACASLELLGTGAWQAQVAALEAGLHAGLAPCRAHPLVADVRVLGGVGVVELHDSLSAEQVARLQRFFVEECGVWIRPFARLIYLMPPYVSTAGDVRQLTASIVRALHLSAEWSPA